MSNDPSVRLSKAFCSARDRNIPVLVQNSPDSTAARGPGGPEGDPALVSCLDYGVRCTGWLCPLFSVPTLPPEELLEEAIEAERRRKARSVAQGRAILERALKEGRLRRTRERRRTSQEPPEIQPRG